MCRETCRQLDYSQVVPLLANISGCNPKALIKATQMGMAAHADVQKEIFEDGCIALIMPTLAMPFVSPAFQATPEDAAVVNGKILISNDILLTPVWNLLNRYPVVDMPVMLSSKRAPIGVPSDFWADGNVATFISHTKF